MSKKMSATVSHARNTQAWIVQWREQERVHTVDVGETCDMTTAGVLVLICKVVCVCWTTRVDVRKVVEINCI